MVADSYGEGLDLFGNVERWECINRVEAKGTKSGKIWEVERAVGAGSPERAVVRRGEESLPVSKRQVHVFSHSVYTREEMCLVFLN